jgi:hypothetical protein
MSIEDKKWLRLRALLPKSLNHLTHFTELVRENKYSKKERQWSRVLLDHCLLLIA